MRLGATDDTSEREADELATRVTSGMFCRPQAGRMPAVPRPIRAKAESGEGSSSIAPRVQSRIESARGGGQSLATKPRQFFESRFGTDFRSVRVHDDATAAAAARDLRARAFTIGSDIFFGANHFSPHSPAGRRLIAHELTHVQQQQAAGGTASTRHKHPVIQRQPDGKSRLEDTAPRYEHDRETGVYEGTVNRQEYVPASGDQPRRDIGSARRARVRFDPSACEVVLPMKVYFEHPSANNWPKGRIRKGNSIPKDPLGANAFRSLADRFLIALGEDLNGWFTVSMSKSGTSCDGKDMTIRVEVTEVESALEADTIVVLVNKEGRSTATDKRITIYAPGVSRSTLGHEGLHAMFGLPDEYPKSGGKDRDPASVRTDDLSRLSRHNQYADWGLLHERHFAFVPAFLERIFPDCGARLREIERPLGVDYHLALGGGYANFSGEGRLGLHAGFDVGIPFDRLRQWQLLVGAHTQMFTDIDAPGRESFLAGLRVGFLGQPYFSEGGIRFGGFVGGGVGAFNPLLGPEGRSGFTGRETAPFLEGGGFLGYNLPPIGGKSSSINADFSAGTSLGIDDAATGESRNVIIFQLGLRAGFAW